MDARFRFRSGRITEMVMQMKKPGILLVLLLAAVLLTGCGSSQPAAPATKEAAVPEQTDAPVSPETARLPEASEETAGSLKAAVEAAVGDAAELAPFTAEELTDMTGIVPEDVADFVFLQGNGMDGREILVIRAKDEASADRVASLLEKYLERRKKEHRDYAPDAYKLLTDAKVERKGLLLAVISGKNAAAELSALLSGE